jgi:hypothetical protein
LDSFEWDPYHNRMNNNNEGPYSWTRAVQLVVYGWCKA